jgi:hypothetical protein
LFAYNVTLLLTNHEFNITEYSYEWTPYTAAKPENPQMMPNGKWQSSSRFFGPIKWMFSMPVFAERTYEVPLAMYSRLLQEAFKVEMTNQPLHLNDVMVYVPFLDLMSTNYKRVEYSNGVIQPAQKNQENELGRVSLSFKSTEMHITRISLSFPIMLILFFGYFLTMYIAFWVPLNAIAFIMNACLTKNQA